MYRPKTELEKKLFPNLGTAKVIGEAPALKKFKGRIGVIVHVDREVVRIIFDEFWDRSTDEIDEVTDNTWCFKGEYERIE